MATWRSSWPGRPAPASWAPGGDGTAPPRWRAARSSSPTLTASASRRWLGRWMSCWTRSAGRHLTVRPPWCGPAACSSRWPCRRRSGQSMAAMYFVVEPNGGELAELARRVQQGRLAPPAGAVRRWPRPGRHSRASKAPRQDRHNGRLIAQEPGGCCSPFPAGRVSVRQPRGTVTVAIQQRRDVVAGRGGGVSWRRDTPWRVVDCWPAAVQVCVLCPVCLVCPRRRSCPRCRMPGWRGCFLRHTGSARSSLR